MASKTREAIALWFQDHVEFSNKRFRGWTETCGVSFLMMDIVESSTWRVFAINDYAAFLSVVTLGISKNTAENLIVSLSILQIAALASYCFNHRRRQSLVLLAMTQILEIFMFWECAIGRILAIMQVALSRSEAIRASFDVHMGMNISNSLGAMQKLNEALGAFVTAYSLGVPLATAGCYGFARNAFAPLMFNGYEAQLGRERFARALGWAACFFSFATYDKNAPKMTFSPSKALLGMYRDSRFLVSTAKDTSKRL